MSARNDTSTQSLGNRLHAKKCESLGVRLCGGEIEPERRNVSAPKSKWWRVWYLNEFSEVRFFEWERIHSAWYERLKSCNIRIDINFQLTCFISITYEV